MIHKPIENCYWVIPGKFLAGEYPRHLDAESSQIKIDALLDAGVSAFIDLTAKNDGLRPYSSLLKTATYHRFPIRDVSIPASPDITLTIINTLDRYLEENQIVYLHCWGGVGRTGVIVGCFLAHHGLEGNEALARLHELWKQCPKSAGRNSPETKEQERYIVNWRESVGLTTQT